MRHSPRKRFGQNFLHHGTVINEILQAINPQAGDNLLEIGPGLGALTLPLLKRVQHLTAVEIDRDLQQYLREHPATQGKLRLIPADALTVDYHQFGSNLRVIGNLPYNISTPLLIHLLDYCPSISDMHFMLQKEVVERMAASPGTKDYGRLSVIIQYYCEVEHLFNVPPEAFDPQPKVDSAIVRLTPYQNSPYGLVNKDALERIVAASFAMRRKTLNNNLKGIISAAELQELNIDSSKRPEQISVAEYVQLAKFISI
ncbi:16S rRNA (adenine(1518)-N(6)/adenine(1519)-N(6))-dimethyltransferase RsmA [Legionella sp. km772]|uniref:16S rRNA (adenine(1518)-N(6)/adenine(1519)-N(6))- dimethyltransferase RsmA n=1 Tax=Legionella sp. km772 TaxID=2498111 RepID=UPI000F8C90AF|nr:16S rRNA (adenine(1518)-N(6)/adenine(1519)-N(6))-dimethyltransferase RsmA [Legionella sp. km772]RUR08464.1 16S rRNA (adenine(1518)-N(6)/adenine(1519)-N(6))-dimethyltransferase RsmA [Legionella sp. km772]